MISSNDPITDGNDAQAITYNLLLQMHPLDLLEPDHDAYVWLDWRNGSVWVGTWHKAHNGVPPSVWYGHVLRAPLPARVDARALCEDLRAGVYTEDIRAVMAGYEFVSVDRARFSEEAGAARDRLIERFAEAEELPDEHGLWDAWEWFEYSTNAELGVKPGMSDDELKGVAESLIAQALEQGVKLYNTLSLLEDRRGE